MTDRRRKRQVRGTLAVAAALVLMASSARAHEDPAGCFQTGPAIIVAVFRANGTTGVVGNVSECETINYRATLTKASNSNEVCAFSQGTFKMTLPNGTVVDINLNVPCIGGTSGEGCDATVTQLQSALIPYTVSPADIVNGFVVATARYAGGVVHDNPANTAGVGANTPKSTPVVRCTDNDLCTDNVCLPNVAGAAACQTTPVTCNDNNQCTSDSCDPTTGNCVFPPAVTCNDNNQCTSDVCNPATGACVFTPTVTCNDNSVCTSDVCDPATGACVFTTTLVCNDNDPCTDDVCDPVLGCQSTPNGNPVCLGMNHFQCYEVKPAAFARRNASVEDRYVDGPVNLRSPNRLCAPVDKNDEDPTAPQDPDHLMSFPSSGSAPRVPNQIVTDQFGELHLDLIRRSHLLVPTAKALVDPPGPLANPVTDHFQCYVARRSSGALKFVRRNNVMTVDQFGSHAVDLLRPRYVCVPANKNDEDPGAPSHEGGLLCYKARHHVRFGEVRPFIDNQFVTEQVRLIRRIDFCVPATIED